MLTRKHYVQIARMLKIERVAIDQLPDNENHKLVHNAQHQTVNNIEFALIDIFRADNPQFDRYRFLDASR